MATATAPSTVTTPATKRVFKASGHKTIHIYMPIHWYLTVEKHRIYASVGRVAISLDWGH